MSRSSTARWEQRLRSGKAPRPISCAVHHLTDDPLRASTGSAIGGTAEAAGHVDGHAAAPEDDPELTPLISWTRRQSRPIKQTQFSIGVYEVMERSCEARRA